MKIGKLLPAPSTPEVPSLLQNDTLPSSSHWTRQRLESSGTRSSSKEAL